MSQLEAALRGLASPGPRIGLGASVSGFRVWGWGFRVWGFRVWGWGLGVWGLGFGVGGLGFRT